VPFFTGLPESERERLAASVRRRSYRRGEVIHHEDDLAGDCFVVTQGHVKHRLTAFDGRQLTHSVQGPGGFFGLLSLIDHKRRAGDAVAVTDTEVLVIDRDLLGEILQRYPETNAALLDSYMGRYRQLLGLIHDLAFLSVPQRLAKVLLLHAREDEAAEHPIVPAFLNQTELAFLVGTTRESVNQTLKRFAREGSVAFERRTLVVMDAEALRRVVGT
jgi:CRP-like cAMP-binding protein